MSDQCQQYKKDYEKLLELKQGFDAALEEGTKSRNFEEAKRVKAELEKVLRKLEVDLKFKVWKTIELGAGIKTANDFFRSLKVSGCKMSDAAKSVMLNTKFNVLSEKTKFELVIISVAELGFCACATLEEIYKRAQEMGLELCPPEVGPQLRLQYKDQPKSERLNIAMETIKGSDDRHRVFNVERDDDDSWLYTDFAHSDSVWDVGDQWVFVKKLKK